MAMGASQFRQSYSALKKSTFLKNTNLIRLLATSLHESLSLLVSYTHCIHLLQSQCAEVLQDSMSCNNANTGRSRNTEWTDTPPSMLFFDYGSSLIMALIYG